MSKPDHLRRIAEILDVCLELGDKERQRYLDLLRSGDPDLVREVEVHLADTSGEATAAEIPSAVTGTDADGGELEYQHIGPYRTLEWLGMGGMGTVYRAARDDQEFEREVAIKVIRLGLNVPEIRNRFLSERQILATLDHPNIAKMYEGGTTPQGHPYLVMEYLDGLPIDRYCDEHRLSIRRRLELFRQVCSAVEYAHRSLIVHRDLKPSNILVTPDGTPKLLDFGIAKLLDPDHFPLEVEATATGMGPLTPNYASPEQIKGQRITTSSDLFSLGVLLYRLITGRLPFNRKSRSRDALIKGTDREAAKRPSLAIEESAVTETDSGLWSTDAASHRKAVVGDLDTIVLKALRPEPEKRYVSVQHLAEDLGRHLEGLPVLARDPSFPYLFSRFAKRYRFSLAAAAVITSLTLGFLAVTATQNVQIRQQAAELETSEARATLEAEKAVEQSIRKRKVAEFFVRLFSELSPQRSPGQAPSGREILDIAARQVTEDQTGDLETRLMLTLELASIFQQFGEPQKALELAQRAAEDAKPLGQEIANESSLGVAAALFALGRHEEMAAVMDDVVPAIEESGSAYQLSRALNLQASALSSGPGRNLDRAEVLAQQALDLAQEAGEETAAHTALNTLGSLMLTREEYGAALPLHEEILDMAERIYPPNHPRVAMALSNLAFVAKRQGQYRKVYDYLSRTHTVMLENFGTRGQMAAISFNNLSTAEIDLALYGDAFESASTAIELLEASAGLKGPAASSFFGRLGDALTGLGRHREADGAWQKALRASEGMPEAARIEARLGRVLSAVRTGRLDDAEQRQAEFEASLTQIDPGAAPSYEVYVLMSKVSAALLLEARGDLEKARPIFEDTVVGAQRVIAATPSTFQLAAIQYWLLSLLYLDRHDAAQEPLALLEDAGWRGTLDLLRYCDGRAAQGTAPEICGRLERGLFQPAAIESVSD
ncbi:MAG: serine/threonine-protein kinase [Acidobacteriota bacterium]